MNNLSINFTNSSTSSAHVLVKIRNNSVIVVKENESPIYIENSTHVTSYDTCSIYFNPDYYDYVPDKQGLYTKFIYIPYRFNRRYNKYI